IAPEEWIELAIAFRLTNRELEGLILLCEDMQEKEIARRLSLKANTVHWIIRRLHQKLEVEDGIGLVLKATGFVITRLRRNLQISANGRLAVVGPYAAGLNGCRPPKQVACERMAPPDNGLLAVRQNSRGVETRPGRFLNV